MPLADEAGAVAVPEAKIVERLSLRRRLSRYRSCCYRVSSTGGATGDSRTIVRSTGWLSEEVRPASRRRQVGPPSAEPNLDCLVPEPAADTSLRRSVLPQPRVPAATEVAQDARDGARRGGNGGAPNVRAG